MKGNIDSIENITGKTIDSLYSCMDIDYSQQKRCKISVKKRGEFQTAGYLKFWYPCPWVENLQWWICLSLENSFSKIEELLISNRLVFLNKHQMLRDSFNDVFRGYSSRADSVRHESRRRYQHCDFTPCQSSTGASVSKTMQFLELDMQSITRSNLCLNHTQKCESLHISWIIGSASPALNTSFATWVLELNTHLFRSKIRGFQRW